MTSISVVQGDITKRACDLLVLKHADGFYGVDEVVAGLVGYNGSPSEGDYDLVSGKQTEARRVLFVGVGPLSDFRYEQIRSFVYRALELASRVTNSVRRICTPIHGPGYGLDETEAFMSLLAGFFDAVNAGVRPDDRQEIEIVELSASRAARLRRLLARTSSRAHIQPSLARRGGEGSNKLAHELARINLDDLPASHGGLRKQLDSYGAASEKKILLFVAMPFSEEFSDEWDISITQAAEAAGILCERIDQQSYVGDVLTNIKARIEKYDGMIALLNAGNPNVFLEIGYAWAMGKPTILLAKKGQELPFDIRGQKCIIYNNIADLLKKLREEMKQLLASNIFTKRQKAANKN